jgi:hypothetical protein
MERNEPENERRNGDAQGDHQGPYSNVFGAFFLEKRLGYHGASDCRRWTDEECDYGSADCHRGIVWAFGTAYVTY